MKKVLKTITLGSAGNPSVVICPGHVDVKTFNKATKAEGWKGGLEYKQKVLQYVYCIEKPLKNGSKFKQVAPNVEGAKPFTWTSWD